MQPTHISGGSSSECGLTTSPMRTKAWLGVLLFLGLMLGFRSARAEGETEDHAAMAEDDDDAAADGAYDEWDPDGDGKEDLELKKEYEEAFAGIPKFDDKSADAEEKLLEERPAETDMQPSMTVDQFRKIVGLARTVVLDRMEKKMAKSAAKKMAHFSTGIFV